MIHFCRSFSTEEGLAAVHTAATGGRSPRHVDLEKLKEAYPELYRLPEVAKRLEQMGNSGLAVLADLEEKTDRAYSVDDHLVGYFYSSPGYCGISRGERHSEWNNYCWLLAISE